jgi:hypothetical protein
LYSEISFALTDGQNLHDPSQEHWWALSHWTAGSSHRLEDVEGEPEEFQPEVEVEDDMIPSICFKVLSKHTIGDYIFLLTMLTTDKISSQISILTKNSKFPIVVANDPASLTDLAPSAQVLSTSLKADLI